MSGKKRNSGKSVDNSPQPESSSVLPAAPSVAVVSDALPVEVPPEPAWGAETAALRAQLVLLEEELQANLLAAKTLGAKAGAAEVRAQAAEGLAQAERECRTVTQQKLEAAVAALEGERRALLIERQRLEQLGDAIRAEAKVITAKDVAAALVVEEGARAERRAAEERERSARRSAEETAFARRRAEVEQQLSAAQALANEAEARRLRAVAAGEGAHVAAAAERERRLAERELDGLREAAAAVDRAHAEAVALLAKAQGDARQVIEAAEAGVRTLWEEARSDAGEVRQKAADEAAVRARNAADAAALSLARAEAEAAKLRGEAERAKVRAEGDAEQRVATAQLEADTLLSAAKCEAAEILARAALDIESLRSRRLSEAAAAEADLQARADVLDGRERELRSLEVELRAEKARQERRARALEDREADLDLDQRDLKDRRLALDQREHRLGAARVAQLEQELAEQRQRVEALGAHGLDLSAQRDTLAQALRDLGGADAAARLEELERLRRRVADLGVELTTRVDVGEVRRLQQEVDILRVFRDRAQATEDERRRLELGQLDIDSRVQVLRTEADRAARARDSAEQRVRELEAEQGQLQQQLSEVARVRAEMDALRSDRDWIDQERQRLLEQLQIRRKAGEESMRRHYGRIALFDDPAGPLQALMAAQRITTDTAPGAPERFGDLAKLLQHRMSKHKETQDDQGRRYRIDDVRAFLACMASSRLIVLKGLSGTGKTSLPLYAARALGGVCGVVKVQSGWRDRVDLVGTYNAFTEELRSQPFSELLYAASCEELRDRPFFIVLDECNLSRVEYYFADLLSELQEPKDEHRLRLLERAPGDAWPKHLDQGIELKIPRNIWFVLTANEDESTFELADKTFDRAAVLQMDQQAPPTVEAHTRDEQPKAISAKWFIGELQRRGRRAMDKDRDAWLGKVQGALLEKLGYGLGNRFPEQARAFIHVFEDLGGDPNDALDRLVATKVLRKVERERDPNRYAEVEAIRAEVAKIPGGKAARSLPLLDRTLKGLR